jgi:hypothetical protein
MKTASIERRQQGAALLIMMLVVLVAATAVLVTKLNSNDARARSLTDAQDVLAEARQALLDYAAVHPDFVPGETVKLPCPDMDASGGLLEGESHTASCGAAGETVMGRFPWRTLGVAPFKDSGEACLWYAVSGSYKDAGGASAAMINADTNGQLQLHGVEAGTVITGAQPADRPVAMIIAPMKAVGGQSRAAPGGSGAQCSASFNAADFLEADALSGISNATLSGAPDVIDQFAVAAGYNGAHNDRIATISRTDLAEVLASRHDFGDDMRDLGLAIAACVADYARNNSGGSNDRRLPWPAPLTLADYRPDAAYDDANAGFLSGRFPDIVDDSTAVTGNALTQVLTACDPAAVPAWTPQMLASWRHWKDHFFYAVAESFTPAAPVPSSCTTCLTVNGAGQYAAVVLYADTRLPSLGQVRNAPPIDADTKRMPDNYLEGGNEGLMPYVSGSVDFTSQTPTATFNDRLFCIDAALNIAEC